MMNNGNISFKKKFNGYDKAQVDSYISCISEAYQTAYDEYNAACMKYNELLEDYKMLEEQENSRPHADIIAKTLVDTEALAQKILANAKADAAIIIADARAGARNVTEDANAEAEAIQQKTSKLIDAAYLEAARVSAQAQCDREETDKIVEQAIMRLREMLAPRSDCCPHNDLLQPQLVRCGYDN